MSKLGTSSKSTAETATICGSVAFAGCSKIEKNNQFKQQSQSHQDEHDAVTVEEEEQVSEIENEASDPTSVQRTKFPSGTHAEGPRTPFKIGAGGAGAGKDYKGTAFKRADRMDANWRTDIRREDRVGAFSRYSPREMPTCMFYEMGRNYQLQQRPTPPSLQHKLTFVVRSAPMNPASQGILNEVVRTKYGYQP